MLMTSCFGPKNNEEKSYTYLALGDSYTIGESVPAPDRWPVQLSRRLKEKGLPVYSPKIVAKTGWRTDELLKQLNGLKVQEKNMNVVSLMIGVNNQYQRKSLRAFDAELERLIEKAVSLCKYGAEGVFMLSIPDYGVTPFAGKKARRYQKN